MSYESGDRTTRGMVRRRIVLTVVLLIVLATIFNIAHTPSILDRIPHSDDLTANIVICLLWCVAGIGLIRQLAPTIGDIASVQPKIDHRAILLGRRAISALAYAFVILVALNILHVKIGNILLGGAVTGVVVGFAGQSTLSNLFAGVILFTVRPLSVGQTVTLRTYLFGGMEYTGTVSDINWYYTILMDGHHQRTIPNSAVVASAITIISEMQSQIYTAPLSYSVSLATFKEQLQEVAGCEEDELNITIREFADTYYLVTAEVPQTVVPEAIRETLHRVKNPCVASETERHHLPPN